MDFDALFEAANDRRDHSVAAALVAALDEATAIGRPDRAAKACLALARLHIARAEYDLAGDLVDRGIAAGSPDEGIRLRLLNLRAYVFLEQGRIAEAVEPLLVARRAGAPHVHEARQAQANLAFALLDLDDVQGASDGFEELERDSGGRLRDLAFSVYGQARCRLRQGRTAEVPALVARLAALPIADPRLRAHEDLLRALVASEEGRWTDARAAAEVGLAGFDTEGGVECLECLQLMARSHRELGEHDLARPFLDLALSRAPHGRHRTPVLRELAKLEVAVGDPSAAVRALEEACACLQTTDGSAGRALRASSARAHADLARQRELELLASHEALQRAYRSVEERVVERTRDLAEAVGALESEVTERRAAEARALAASRAKNQFLASMSHELRTPLNAILGYTELLLEEEDTPAPVAKDLRQVHASAVHLLALVDDLLDLARVEAGRLPVNPSPTDLDRLLDDVVARVGPQLTASETRLELDRPPRLPPFRTDPVRLQQILQNLLSNSARHTRRGVVRLEIAVRGKVLRCVVSDTGSGIAPELLPRVFEPFVQGAAGAGRAGLGLALVRHLCEALQGTVQLSSEVGSGTTAIVSLLAFPESPSP